MFATRLTAAVAAALLTADLAAHGGQYRGPGNAAPPGVPVASGPGGPTGAGAPGTAGRAASSDETSWQVWWEFNKEPFLQRRIDDVVLPVSGSDEFYLGQRRKPPSRTMRPDARDRTQRIVPALAAALRKERNRDLATACLVALAKVGVDAPPEAVLDELFADFLDRDDQEVRETAALAFGIAGRAGSLPLLHNLLRDTPAGRRLLDKAEVNDRTRAFAAYSLGMLGRRAADPEVRRQVHDLLAPILVGDRDDDRDLRVAVVTGLGMLRPPDGDAAADKLLAWRTVDELWQFYGRDIGKADQVQQAHVPIAVARLLGRGSSAAHQRAKRTLADELTGRERRHNTILQSAALTLGQLCLPPEQEPEDAAFQRALLQAYEQATDQQTRFFAVLALGRIGGAANRTELLRRYADANTGTERPWVALALGLIAHRSQQQGEVDISVARLLLGDLQATSDTSARAAFAVALGLTGASDLGPAVQELLADHEREEVLAGYLCTSLALLGDHGAVPALRALVARSVRRPFLLQQAAVALGRLGNEEVVPQLQAMLAEHTSTAALSAIASALSLIGDRRSIDALVAMLQDDEHTQLARAFAAAALGGVGDKDELPWNEPLSRDVNYRARVDTLFNGKAGVLDIL